MWPTYSTVVMMLYLQSLSDGDNKSTVVATQPKNKQKNHFANICVCKYNNHSWQVMQRSYPLSFLPCR